MLSKKADRICIIGDGTHVKFQIISLIDNLKKLEQN